MSFFRLLVAFPVALSQCTTAICDSFDTYTGSLVNGGSYGPKNLIASIVTTNPIWAEVDSKFYYSAPSSLHVNCTAAGPTQATLSATPSAAWADVYGRAMFYYSNASGNAIPTTVHSWIFNAAGTNTYFNTHDVPGTGAPNGAVSMNLIVKEQLCLNYHWGGSEMGVCSTGKPVHANQWFCIQWHYDGPNSNAEVWVDGTQVISVVHHESTDYTPINSSQWRFADSPGWNKLQFGWRHYQTLPAPVDLHLDDVVLDTKATCCPCVGFSYCCPTSAPSTKPSAPTKPTTSAPTTPTAKPAAPTTTAPTSLPTTKTTSAPSPKPAAPSASAPSA